MLEIGHAFERYDEFFHSVWFDENFPFLFVALYSFNFLGIILLLLEAGRTSRLNNNIIYYFA